MNRSVNDFISGGIIISGITPAIKKITAFSGISACMSRNHFCGNTVVYDKNLTQITRRKYDLVKFGIVVNTVKMKPIHTAAGAAKATGLDINIQ